MASHNDTLITLNNDTILKCIRMLDKNNSFETALPCRPRTCLSTTLQSNLFQRDAENCAEAHLYRSYNLAEPSRH